MKSTASEPGLIFKFVFIDPVLPSKVVYFIELQSYTRGVNPAG